MSQEYIFYPALKQNGIYKPITFDRNGDPQSLFWRSRSFIDGDYFRENFSMIDINDIEEKYRSHFDLEFGIEDAPSYVYDIPIEDLRREGSECGVVSGYSPLDEIRDYYNSDDKQEYLRWVMSKPLPAEVMAEMPEEERRKYGKFFTIDFESTSYVCFILSTMLTDILVPYELEDEKRMLMLFSF